MLKNSLQSSADPRAPFRSFTEERDQNPITNYHRVLHGVEAPERISVTKCTKNAQHETLFQRHVTSGPVHRTSSVLRINTHSRRHHQRINTQTHTSLINSPTPIFSSSVGVHMMSRRTKSKIPKKVKSPDASLHGDPTEVSPEREREEEEGRRGKVYFKCSRGK